MDAEAVLVMLRAMVTEGESAAVLLLLSNEDLLRGAYEAWIGETR